MSGRRSAIDFSNEGDADGKRTPGEVDTTRRSDVVAGLETMDESREMAFHEIVTSKFVIGRESSCNLLINDTKISRKHACIRQSGLGYTIEDLGSSNGTIVNGKAIEGVVALKVGDNIRIGKQVFTFKISVS